jgi:hypothetical protein
MYGEMEYGTCKCCGEVGPVIRTYFNYGVKCECHSPEHFEIVWHCYNCKPVDPGIKNIKLSAEQKHKTCNI